MRLYGIDFTSAPTRRKPITCAVCDLDGDALRYVDLQRFVSFAEFEALLATPGPWVAAIDFSFGQSQRFIENMGWPPSWAAYVRALPAHTRDEFRDLMKRYRDPRPTGDKEHRRASDHITGAVSPQKVYGVPVGMMFFEGAHRILDSGATIAGLHSGDPERLIFEAYPGVLARGVTRDSYKNDDPRKQTAARASARRRISDYLLGAAVREDYGVTVDAPESLADDPTGDSLDALACAVQAAWAWRAWPQLQQQLTGTQRLEGWIADPRVFADG